MATPPRQRLTVWAGDAKVAMAASAVAEVIRGPRVTRMPHGPPSLLGVTHLRGQVVPVVSLTSLLGREARLTDRVVILQREPPIGLAVDGVEALKALMTEAAELGDGQLLLDDTDGARWIDLDAALDAQFAAFRTTGRARAVIAESAGAAGKVQRVAEQVYLGFELAGQAYALPLAAVSEVSAVPAEIAALPKTEDILRGVAQRRDAVLPILSTRTLLGLAERGLQGGERLVVTRVGDQVLGLIVDRISAILRVPEDRLAPAPRLFNRGAGEARIEHVLRMPDGKGVVAVLSPERLLADERVARLLADVEGSGEAIVADTLSVAQRERFVVVQLGDERYGLPVAAVDEVVRRPDSLTRLPKAPAYVQGVMNLRGRVIPVIDQRQRFSVAGEGGGAGRIVVVTLGGLQAGFAVDGVASILEVDREELLPAPGFADAGDQVFDRAVQRDGEVILLIDPKALLDRAEADLLRDLTATAS